MVIGSLNVDALIDVIGKAIPDEILALIADSPLLRVGEVDHACL